jgi:hypothetical protein
MGFVLLVWALVATTVSATGQGTVSPAARSSGNELIASIPFEESGSSVFLPVSVNGSPPLWFNLDSGANTCLVDVSHAKQLGIKLQETKQGTGAGAGPVTYFTIRKEDASFKLKSIVFSCEHTAAIDLSQNFASTGHDLDGVIGSDFFEGFVVEINYEAHVVRIFDPKNFEYKGPGETVPLMFYKRLPHVEASLTVQGQATERKLLLVDSGSEDAVDDEIILKSVGPKREVTGGVGLGKEYKVTFGTISQFRLGSITLENLPSVAPGVSLVGGEILRRFTIVFDYGRRRMYWEPNSHLADSFEIGDPSGIDLRLAPDRRTFSIHEVRKNSAAERAGLRAGDRISEIDGVSAPELGLRRAARLFSRKNSHYAIVLERGGERFRVSLDLD